MKRTTRDDGTTDAGFTLTEVLVSMALFTLVSAMVTAASVTGLRHQTEQQNRSDVLAQARTALQRIDRDIRSTYPLLAASATRIVLQDVQPSLTRVMTYSVVGSQLTVDQTVTSTDGTTVSAPRKVLLDNLVDTATNPVFSFAPISDYTAPTGSGVNPTTCRMTDGTIDAGCVGTITVHVTVQPAHVSGPVSLSDNGTDLRNAA